MLQAFEGIYRNGVREIIEFTENIYESRVLITFLNEPSIHQSPLIIQFGMFSGEQKSTEADFEMAQFQGDTEDGLDWS